MKFSIKYNSKFLLETFTFQFILIYAMFGRMFELTEMGNKILLFLFLLCIFKHAKKVNFFFSKKWKIVCFLIFLVIIIFCNVLAIGNNAYLTSNLLIIAYSSIFGLTLNYLVTVLGEESIRILDRNFVFINLFWLMNLVALALQLQGTGFLIKSQWLQSNPYYPDHCCGLFGNSGTHELGFFSCFIFVYNWTYALSRKKQTSRNVIQVYTVLSMILMLFFSLKNDNKAFFVLLFVVVLLFYACFLLWRAGKLSTILPKMISVGICVCACMLLALTIPKVQTAVKEYVELFINILEVDYTMANGSNERLAIFKYALSHGNGWFLGKGLGIYGLTQNVVGVFKHFGINSMGAMTYLGGIWYYLSNCVLQGMCFAENVNARGKKTMLNFVSICIFVGFSFYSNIFTSGVSMVWIVLLSVVLRKMYILNRYARYSVR